MTKLEKEKVVLRVETAEDRMFIYDVIQKAFLDAEYSDHKEQELVDKIRIGESYIPELALVAEYEEEIVGYILYSKIKVDNEELLALAPVAVLPEYQKQNVGTKLIEAGDKIAADLGYRGIVVLGHSDYYPKFGYQRASGYAITPPFDVPDECFMVKELFTNSLESVKGEVVYSKEFFE